MAVCVREKDLSPIAVDKTATNADGNSQFIQLRCGRGSVSVCSVLRLELGHQQLQLPVAQALAEGGHHPGKAGRPVLQGLQRLVWQPKPGLHIPGIALLQ